MRTTGCSEFDFARLFLPAYYRQEQGHARHCGRLCRWSLVLPMHNRKARPYPMHMDRPTVLYPARARAHGTFEERCTPNHLKKQP